jgi:hypothetical protein
MATSPVQSHAQLEQLRQELEQKVQQFRAEVQQFRQEQEAFEHERRTQRPQGAPEPERRERVRQELAERLAALEQREQHAAAEQSKLEAKAAQLMTESLQLASREEELEQQAADLKQRHEELEQRQSDVQREGTELEEQFFQLEQHRAQLEAETQRLDQQKQSQEEQDASLSQRGVEMDRRQAELAHLEELRAELNRRQRELEAQRERQTDKEKQLAQQSQELNRRGQAIDVDQRSVNTQRDQLAKQMAQQEAGQRQLAHQQQQAATQQARLEQQTTQQEQRSRQLADAQAKIETQRRDAQQRLETLAQKEKAADARNEQLRRDGEKLASEQKALAKQVADYQQRFAALEERRAALDRQEQEARRKHQARQTELDRRAETLRKHEAELKEAVARDQAWAEQLGEQRRALARERAQRQEELDALAQRQAETQASFDTLRHEALELLGQLGESGRDTGVLGERVRSIQEQLHNHVNGNLTPIDPASAEDTPALAPALPKLSSGERAPGDPDLEKTCAWYRQRLRSLAETGAASANNDGALSNPGAPEHRVLNLVPVDPADQRLGKALRDLQLVDADVLSVLVNEARRQRRTLRQLLLSRGEMTLYQLAVIEAGDLAALMLGPVRVIDHLRATAHEAFFRVFDPRRNRAALLRHLVRAELLESARRDEYRQRFAKAILNEPHVDATVEILEIQGRPAVLQEWLEGLPATDWPAQNAAGVCYRLLTQAATGLVAIHAAGLVHGHLGAAHLFLTTDGVLKVTGAGELPWLYGETKAENDPRADLRALGRIMTSLFAPAGSRRGSRSKTPPDSLLALLERLTLDGEKTYADATTLLTALADLRNHVSTNAEAWDRLLKHVRGHGSPAAALPQTA